MNEVLTGPPPIAAAQTTPPGRQPAIPSAVLGTLIFIGSEAMLFAGFISAFTIVKANYPPGAWPPPGQPRLPIESTAFNSALLLLSGVLMAWAGRRFLAGGHDAARRPYALAAVLGASFVGLQGVEWARLLADGLTITSGAYGGFFYLIVGAHALHAIGALTVLLWTWTRLVRHELPAASFQAVRYFWYFVVLVWPVLYGKVYL